MFSARSSKTRPGSPPRRPPSKTASSSKLVGPKAGAPKPPTPAASKYAGWKLAFEAGVGAYKSGNYSDAVQAFDEATTLGGHKTVVLDSRAATLEKLGRIKEALLDAKSLVELAPDSHKGYVRGSHLSTLLSPPNYVRAYALLQRGLQLAPSHLRPALQARLAVLHASSQNHSSIAAQRRRNWTDRLPAELLVLIGEQSTLHDSDAVLRLAAVCLRWRDIACSSPTLWARLRLTQKRPKVKLALFSELSNDRLDSLVILPSAGDVVSFVVPHVSAATSFHLAIPPAISLSDALETLRHSLSSDLRHFQIEGPPRMAMPTTSSSSDTTWQSIVDCMSSPDIAGGSQLAALSLARVNVVQPVNDDPAGPFGFFPRMRRLALAGVNSIAIGEVAWGLPDLLERTPRLEELSITNDTSWLYARLPDPLPGGQPTPPPTVNLPELRVLIYSSSAVPGLEDLRWDVPKLERLDVSIPRMKAQQSALYTTILFPPSGPDLQIATLTYLNVARTLLDEPLLIAHLGRLPSLVDLQVGLCNVSNELLEALTLAPVAGSADTCPRLEVLGVSHSDRITGGPLLRLVASRLPSSEPANDDGTGRAALLSLNIDACPAVEDKALEWLQPRLSSFSCKVPKVPKAGFVDRMRRGF